MRLLPAGLLALAWGFGAPAQACELHISAARSGQLLQTITLGRPQQIELSYLHSVTRTLVRETLAVDGEGFVQERIEFSVPGPGLPTETLPGEHFERQAGGFVYSHMHRRVPVLLMRVDPAQAQTLQADGVRHPLTAWGAQALQLAAQDCH
jgi:hypothetical protein